MSTYTKLSPGVQLSHHCLTSDDILFLATYFVLGPQLIFSSTDASIN